MSGLTGKSIIGGMPFGASAGTTTARDRFTGEALSPEVSLATAEAVELATALARDAFASYKNSSGALRAKFLRTIADRLEAIRPEIVARAHQESALPEARLNGELGRTTGQLRMFADIAESESWLDRRVDEALPDRQPLPRPSIISCLRPVGPVVVFGASNFPLAFSVAGGDTASALAAGCPVIVKAHSAHPGTSELVGQQVSAAAEDCGLPVGVFAMIFGAGAEVGSALVSHPVVKAVGFTGSRGGGLALVKLAQARPEPIPVYAEMSSINPIVALPGKLTAEFATGLHGSVTLGVGQFCTNPGLVFAIDGEGYGAFESKLVELIAATPVCKMLTDGIGSAYLKGASALAGLSGVETLVSVREAGAAGLFRTTAATFQADGRLQDEVFGPATLIVRCADVAEAVACITGLEGQLTASIHAASDEFEDARLVADALEDKVGRLIFNQFPTGVEVCNAMVHGGPYPATSDPRTTSVGGRAIDRWARPIAYQNWPW